MNIVKMIEIAYSKEKGILRNMPQEVQETIEGYEERVIKYKSKLK